MSKAFYKALGEATDRLLAELPRRHLGASQVGEKCALQGWLDFRWAGFEKVEPRMRRLWDRGHAEEHRFMRWLRAMDIEVRDYATRLFYHDGSDSYVSIDWDEEPDTISFQSEPLDDVSDDPVHIQRATERGQGPKQWSFIDHNGHYGGSGDAQLSPNLAKFFSEIKGLGWGLLECKTHAGKYYRDLKKKGVQVSQPKHYIQMQQYMHYFDLNWALYIAVNKDDDDIHVEVVLYKEEVAVPYAERAGKIINNIGPPKKLTEDASWYECRMCDYRPQCHFGEPLENQCCRSCAFSQPTHGGRWRCNKYNQNIPEDFEGKKCDLWESCL